MSSRFPEYRDQSACRDAPYVPSGPPPTAYEFATLCGELQRELLWARHDRNGRRLAVAAVEHIRRTMAYMAGGGHVPPLPVRPDELQRMRPAQAAARTIEALTVALHWARGLPSYRSIAS